MAVLLSAHQMNVVEELCDRIFLIHQGQRLLYAVTSPLLFVLGYLLTSSLYAALGAAMKAMQTGNQLVSMVATVPVIPLMLTAMIIQDPHQPLVQVISYLPPLAPGTMLLRLAVTDLPWWEIGASLALLVGFVWLLMRFAAKIFEVGMLMYGKQASLSELWHWGGSRSVGFDNVDETTTDGTVIRWSVCGA